MDEFLPRYAMRKRGLCCRPVSVRPSDVGLTSVAYVVLSSNSRTERPRKTKIYTDVAHVTRDTDTTWNWVSAQGVEKLQ